jgi:hypothetical protein
MTHPVRRLARRFGYDITRLARGKQPFTYPLDFDDAAKAVCAAVEPYTLTRPERIGALREAVHHVVDHGVPGAFVECGVWRGGSMMAVALSLLEKGVTDRDLYLFDTYGPIPAPTDVDVDVHGHDAKHGWQAYMDQQAFTPVEEVRANLASTGYPMDRVHLPQGLVEDTLPSQAPDEVALLRLDTDYYASTKHELTTLWPRIPRGGVLLVDDYGHFAGSKKAVDEYFGEHRPYLHRVDYTCRLVLKS